MTGLPSFPVDPGTLAAVLDAMQQHPGATHITAAPTLDELLELLAGWTPEGDETIHDGAVHVTTGPLYTRDDVILALITEVQNLRAADADPEHDSPTGQCSDNCSACWGTSTVQTVAEEVAARARAIIAHHNDPEAQHAREDQLLHDLVKRYAPAAVYAEVARLAAADFPRWSA